jgi:C1A family cysteine protease
MKKSQIKVAAAALFMLGAFGASSFAQELSSNVRDQIAQVQRAIKDKGAKWTAGETNVSSQPDNWKYLVGLNFQPITGAPAPLDVRASVPRSLDWRDHGGDYVTAARNQKKCGSCWAFSMTGAMESYVLRTQNMPGQDIDLSEQVMLSCSGAGSCQGGQIDPTFLQTTGLPLEEAYPYTATDGTCSAAAPGWQDGAYKIAGWGSVSHTVAALKAALNKYGPLPVGMVVYEDFMHYKNGIYSYTSGKQLGGHGVLLVGYNDDEQSFTVKNSWDTGWGEGGFFRIAYSEVTNSVRFGMSAAAYYSSYKAAPVASAFNADAAIARVAPQFNNIAWN